MPTTSLAFSKLLHTVLGDVETEKIWYSSMATQGNWTLCLRSGFTTPIATLLSERMGAAAPDFGELLRSLGSLMSTPEMRGWRTSLSALTIERAAMRVGRELSDLYISAPTESEGLIACEAYLTPLLERK